MVVHPQMRLLTSWLALDILKKNSIFRDTYMSPSNYKHILLI